MWPALRWLPAALGLGFAVGEVILPLPPGTGSDIAVSLSTRGPSSFRVAVVTVAGGNGGGSREALETPMVRPDVADAPFEPVTTGLGQGIQASFGSILLSRDGSLALLDSVGALLTESQPLRQGSHGVSLTTRGGRLYGRGGGQFDARHLEASVVAATMTNTEAYVPHYFSGGDGYAALGVVGTRFPGRSARVDPRGDLEVNYTSDGRYITWQFGDTYDLYLMPAKSLDLATRAYFALTGAPRVPPRYVFGFMASRWGWSSREHLESDLKSFRAGSYPIDAFICDFEFFTATNDYNFTREGGEDYQDFGFNGATFPKPQEQLSGYASELHLHMGAIRKPRLGNTENLRLARAKGWTLPVPTYADRYLNFELPEVRSWYSNQTKHYLEDGVSFWWNDEGEADYFTYYWWNQAEAEALRSVDASRRFFSLNRAFSPGMARLGAAVWTGDIEPTWEALSTVPGSFLNWGLAGAPFVACDIGGFYAGVSADLLARWYQVGTFMPIMRVHSAFDATPHFPWLWGERHASVMRRALELRYQLLPFHYSLAHRMYSGGPLWMQPMTMAFPAEPALELLTSQWMDGDLLVAPVLREDSQQEVHLPVGNWYAFNSSEVRAGPTRLTGEVALEEIPVFVRAGGIIPVGPVVQHTGALPGDPLEIQVYAGADGAFSLVEDDGESTAYERGGVRTTLFEWDEASKTLTWHVSGAAPGPHMFTRMYAVVFYHGGSRRSKARRLGSSGSISFDDLEAVNTGAVETTSASLEVVAAKAGQAADGHGGGQGGGTRCAGGSADHEALASWKLSLLRLLSSA